MIELVENLAHADDVGRYTRRRLVVRDEHGLDLMLLVRGQAPPVLIERHALAPFDVYGVDVEAKALAEIDPKQRELAKHGSQHLVAGRQRIGDGRFPAAGARARKNEDLAVLGLKDL